MGAGLSWQPHYQKEIECLWQHLLTAVCSLHVVCVRAFLAIGKTSKLDALRNTSKEDLERGRKRKEERGKRRER